MLLTHKPKIETNPKIKKYFKKKKKKKPHLCRHQDPDPGDLQT